MKKNKYLIFLLTVLVTACANTRIPRAKITFKVVNQEGIPIVNEPVRVAFSAKDAVYGSTDINGYFSAEGRTVSDYFFAIGRLHVDNDSPKYYKTVFSKRIADWKDWPEDGKWKPWNETIEIIVKEKLNPTPMYANGNKFKMDIPRLNEWVGYDFEYNDWLKPYGKGVVADIEICLSEKKQTEADELDELKIRFPYPLAGAYIVSKEQNSDLKSVYHADSKEAYQQEIVWYKRYQMKDEINYHAWTEEESHIKVMRLVNAKLLSKDDYIIFRTRTKVDENGNLIEARYGKIYGPIEFNVNPNEKRLLMNTYVNIMYYYLNPDVNDTNLEYNSERNLLFEKLSNELKGHERSGYLRIQP